MLILRTLMIIVEVLCGLILIGLVLIQKSKGGGLGGAIGGGGMGENIFGSRTGNVLTKMTVLFGIVFMANTLFLAMIYSGEQERSLMSREAVTAPLAAPAPAAPPTLPATPGAAGPGAPAPAGAPTLPGADFGDEPGPQQPAPIRVEPVEPAAEEAETATP